VDLGPAWGALQGITRVVTAGNKLVPIVHLSMGREPVMTVKPTKRAYTRPALERISLVGEETAAVPNCKRANGGGRNRSFPNPCRTTGGAPVRCFDARGS